MLKKTIIAHFFTTIDFKIAFRSFLILINPFCWNKLVEWKYIKICEDKLLKYLWVENSKIISFYNARSAIHNTMKLIWINSWDEIIIQAYTCVSVPNAIIQAWWKPIYCDIDETLNLDTNLIEKSITSKTKAIITQNTFWNTANVEKILDICKKYNLVLIEDSAHSLWSQINGKKVWTFWDFWIFSTWRDKVISTVTWWFLVINNSKYFDKIEEIKSSLKNISKKLAIRNIMYNLSAYKAYKLYDFFKLWRFIIYLSRKLNLITEILTLSEKKCEFKDLNYKLPNCLAYLWTFEIDKIDEYNNHRIEIAKIYEENLKINNSILTLKDTPTDNSLPFKGKEATKKENKNIYFWFPILTQKSKELSIFCKQNNILLWNYWNWNVIIPIWTDLEKAWYLAWNCPNAEKLCKQVLTLPNHNLINTKDAEKVIKVLNMFD